MVFLEWLLAKTQLSTAPNFIWMNHKLPLSGAPEQHSMHLALPLKRKFKLGHHFCHLTRKRGENAWTCKIWGILCMIKIMTIILPPTINLTKKKKRTKQNASEFTPHTILHLYTIPMCNKWKRIFKGKDYPKKY